MIAKIRSFLQGVKIELEKVTWPSRKETMATAWVVIFIVLLISCYLGACDYLLTYLLSYFLKN